MSEPIQEAGHNGPIKSPQQLLLAVLFSFVVPIFAIIGLVYFVTSGNKPSGSVDDARHSLGGVSSADLTRGIEERLRKVGMVEIRDSNRPLKGGEEVFKAQCTACHAAGVAGAPKLGDVAAWAPRIKTGYEALLNSALKGKGAMGPQGGGDFEDVEIGRAVVYMTNAAGAKFAEPQRATAAATADSGAAGSAAGTTASQSGATGATGATMVATAAASPMAPAPVQPAAQPAAAGASAAISVAAAAVPGAGEALYKQACVACHAAGVAGAPKLGDKTAWAPRIALGIPALTQSVIKGKNAMPPRGGSQAGDAEIRTAVEYMVGMAK